MTERKSMVSERAELVTLADEYIGMAKAHRAMGEKKEASNCELIVTALRSLAALDQKPGALDPLEMLLDAARYAEGNGGKCSNLEWAKAARAAVAKARLAAQDQKPVAWQWNTVGTWHTVDFRECEDPEKYARSFGYPVRAIYLSPPPSAGWDKAIEAARLAITELDCMYVTQDDVTTRYEYAGIPTDPESAIFREVVQKCEASIKALRHNAPPDSGAGKSASPAVVTYTNYRGETSVRNIIPRSVRYGSTEWHPEPQWLLLAYDTEKNADREFALKDFGVPDHGGADAGVIDARWRTELDEIVSHLGAAITQSIATDDKIIMDHVKAAHEIAKVVRRQA